MPHMPAFRRKTSFRFYRVRAPGLTYLRFLGFEPPAPSVATDIASCFFSVIFFGLRTSRLPIRLAIFFAFPAAIRAHDAIRAAAETAPENYTNGKGPLARRRYRNMSEPGLMANLKPHLKSAYNHKTDHLRKHGIVLAESQILDRQQKLARRSLIGLKERNLIPT